MPRRRSAAESRLRPALCASITPSRPSLVRTANPAPSASGGIWRMSMMVPGGSVPEPGSGQADQMCTASPSRVVCAPGQGLNARTCRQMSTAGRFHAISPSALCTRLVIVARLSSCGRGVISPRNHEGSVAARRSAPISASEFVSEAVLSRGETATRVCARIGPESIPGSISMIVTPVSSSPARIAPAIGDAPRQRGRSDG